MKKIVYSAALIVALAGSVFAQDGSKRQQKTPEEKAKNLTEVYEKKLNLTASQKAKIYTLNLERATKMEQFRSEGKGNREEREAVMTDIETQIAAILNDDQRKTYAEIKEKAKEQRGRRSPRGDAGK